MLGLRVVLALLWHGLGVQLEPCGPRRERAACGAELEGEGSFSLLALSGLQAWQDRDSGGKDSESWKLEILRWLCQGGQSLACHLLLL